MYTPIAAEIVRRETARAALTTTPVPRPRAERQQGAVRRRLSEILRRSADRLAPEG